MEKWADCCISDVRYDRLRVHITDVRVRLHDGYTIGPPVEWSRDLVAWSIEGGKTFVTITMGSDGRWRKGERVGIVLVNGVKYISTDANGRKGDNLGQLPEF